MESGKTAGRMYTAHVLNSPEEGGDMRGKGKAISTLGKGSVSLLPPSTCAYICIRPSNEGRQPMELNRCFTAHKTTILAVRLSQNAETNGGVQLLIR